jgi:membrane-bound lytic murein transglycosylase MltF
MQIEPSTAAAKPIGITGVDRDPDRNVHAGCAYLRYLADTYVSDPAIDPLNRTLMSFAAYNAGPGSLRKFRAAARQAGLDPNVWFNNVELGAAKRNVSTTLRQPAFEFKLGFPAFGLAG